MIIFNKAKREEKKKEELIKTIIINFESLIDQSKVRFEVKNIINKALQNFDEKSRELTLRQLEDINACLKEFKPQSLTSSAIVSSKCNKIERIISNQSANFSKHEIAKEENLEIINEKIEKKDGAQKRLDEINKMLDAAFAARNKEKYNEISKTYKYEIRQLKSVISSLEKDIETYRAKNLAIDLSEMSLEKEKDIKRFEDQSNLINIEGMKKTAENYEYATEDVQKEVKETLAIFEKSYSFEDDEDDSYEKRLEKEFIENTNNNENEDKTKIKE